MLAGPTVLTRLTLHVTTGGDENEADGQRQDGKSAVAAGGEGRPDRTDDHATHDEGDDGGSIRRYRRTRRRLGQRPLTFVGQILKLKALGLRQAVAQFRDCLAAASSSRRPGSRRDRGRRAVWQPRGCRPERAMPPSSQGPCEGRSCGHARTGRSRSGPRGQRPQRQRSRVHEVPRCPSRRSTDPSSEVRDLRSSASFSIRSRWPECSPASSLMVAVCSSSVTAGPIGGSEANSPAAVRARW